MTALNLNALTLNTPSTSGSYTSFSVTRDQIIRAMMLDLGALQEGEVPTAQEVTDCAFKLNMLVKQWKGNTDFAPGLKVWTRKRADLFLGYAKYAYQLGLTGDNWAESTTNLTFPQQYGQTNVAAAAAPGATTIAVASVAAFSINDAVGFLVGNDIFWTTVSGINPVPTPPTISIPAPGLPAGVLASGVSYVWNYTSKGLRPVYLVSAILRDIYANDTPLRIFRTVEEYEALPNKTAPSNVADPTAVFYEARFKNQAPNGLLLLDVAGAQDVTKHLHCVYLSDVQDFVNPGDAPDYPSEWYLALTLGLGKLCAGMFDVPWTADMESNLTAALAIARQGYPEESSVYFQVQSDDGQYGP